jgi:2-polyprenyl-3-methyl-5-hydroxy-6-metoxy-1,4-benzoquinol methylase
MWIGLFFESISKNLPHRKLVCIGVSLPPLTQHYPDIEFKVADIINFNLNYKFDVVFSDQVLEHITPVDLPMHLRSVGLSLKDGGVFIVNMPNRLFGPSDVTRIVDFTYTGKTAAQGTHLNESTYTELIPILENHGFKNCGTVCFLPKLKRFLINWRVSPWPLQVIEGSLCY